MKIKMFQVLERMFQALATWSQNMQMRCAICKDCGQNRYTGKPCK